MRKYLWILLFMLGVVGITSGSIYANKLIKEHIEVTHRNNEIRHRNDGYGGRASFKTSQNNNVLIIIIKQE